MKVHNHKTRILFFIGSLCGGGKERRLIELLTYLKDKGSYELMLVLTKDQIHYPAFHQLDIPYQVLRKNWKRNDLTIFYQFYKVCRQFQPNLIHTWGRIQSLYSVPAALAFNIPLVNSQITTAPPASSKKTIFSILDKIIFHFSAVILSNSKAGQEAFHPPAHKSQVIYNGLNLQRFRNLPAIDQIKSKYNIDTPFTVVMAASFTDNKDYDLFFDLADKVTRVRDDITFIGVGRYEENNPKYARLVGLSRHNPRILFPGRIEEVEALVQACDIGVLFSQDSHGEGLSNAILEYMALGKPVIANDNGGTKELVHHQENGFLITHQTTDEIAGFLIGLLENQEQYQAFSAAGKKFITETFTLESMGLAFEQVYRRALPAASFSLVAADYPVLSRSNVLK